jgi:Cu+-exporting ATPase
MKVDPATAKFSHQHGGRTYYFCCGGCREKFIAAPDKILSSGPKGMGPGLVMLGMPPAAPKGERTLRSSNAAKDPVCGMDVDPATARFKTEHGGKEYFFCSAGCLEKFRANPEKVLSAPPRPMGGGLVTLGMSAAAGMGAHRSITKADGPAAGKDTRIYICPMCPEVRQVGPGPCPKCGMALEPESPALPATKTEYTCPMHPEIVRAEPGSCPICGMALEPRTVPVEEENPELRDMTRRFWVSLALTAPLLAIAMGSMVWPHLLMRSPWN